MPESQTTVGLVVVVGCGIGFRYAYELAQLSEQLDSIGSTTSWGEIEPAIWKVILYRAGAAMGALLGAMMFIGSIL